MTVEELLQKCVDLVREGKKDYEVFLSKEPEVQADCVSVESSDESKVVWLSNYV